MFDVPVLMCFTEGLEEPIVAVSNNGFSLPEITIMEGQVFT